MTNILSLPQLKGDGVAITRNSDWRDTIQFAWGPNTTRQGQPLDITGISFRSQMRPTADDPSVILDMSTDNGLLVVDGALGQLSFAVPRDQPTSGTQGCTSSILYDNVVIDLIASADGMIINLFQVTGFCAVVVKAGVTR